MTGSPFHIKVRIGDHEGEIGGTKEEGMETLEDPESIVEKVSLAFKENMRLSWEMCLLPVQMMSRQSIGCFVLGRLATT